MLLQTHLTFHLIDLVRGFDPSQPVSVDDSTSLHDVTYLGGSTKVVVVLDTQDLNDAVIVGVNANDRPGLLLDISRGLHSMGLQLHHTEASVILSRSISIWRCEVIDSESAADADEMRSVLKVSLSCNFVSIDALCCTISSSFYSSLIARISWTMMAVPKQ